jgi:hypothetical protein
MELCQLKVLGNQLRPLGNRKVDALAATNRDCVTLVRILRESREFTLQPRVMHGFGIVSIDQ